eukprot:XP_025001573.1 chitin-binding lectin 1-like isoform X1 [Gallus gallus]
MHRTSGMRLSPGLHFRRSLCLSGPAGPGALPTFFPGGALPGGVPAPSPTPELLRASNPALRQRLSRSAAVFAAFVSPAEGAAVLREAEEALRRRRYEDGHWDGAISGFREAERSRWGALSGAVLQRISSAFPPARPPLPHSHILDLAPHGCVRPHIDSTKFCGCTITLGGIPLPFGGGPCTLWGSHYPLGGSHYPLGGVPLPFGDSHYPLGGGPCTLWGVPLPFGGSHYPLGGCPITLWGDPITHWGVPPPDPPPSSVAAPSLWGFPLPFGGGPITLWGGPTTFRGGSHPLTPPPPPSSVAAPLLWGGPITLWGGPCTLWGDPITHWGGPTP